KLWAHLEDAVREGTHRWPQAYGWDGPIFSHFFNTEAAKREFLMGMHGYGLISSPHVVSAFDLSQFQHLVDLGGATGHLACAACERYPHLRATVFDLPDAIPLAQEIIATTKVSSRVTTQGGDFFRDPLPAADLYAVGRILHDWSLEKVHQLLQKMFAALPVGGGVLIAEKLLIDDKTAPRWALLQSLNMLTCTEGKERNQSEYADLLYQHGFSKVSVCRTTAPLDAVLAIK
ncbi:MAG: homocysteine methyltransferase, partial [Pirellulaceae bacterium]|nr:homocysteine methyltransferase [Pirellulaceae bacterium]